MVELLSAVPIRRQVQKVEAGILQAAATIGQAFSTLLELFLSPAIFRSKLAWMERKRVLFRRFWR